MALPVYTDPNAGGDVYDPQGADIQQAMLAEALRRQKLREQQAQAGAYAPMGGQMVGTQRYQHYVPDYGAGFRNMANIIGSKGEMAGAQGAFDKQAQARASREQQEFERWKAMQPKAPVAPAPAPAPAAAALPQTMDSIGGSPGPKAPGAGFQQVGYEPDAEAPLPDLTPVGVGEALDDSEEDDEGDDSFNLEPGEEDFDNADTTDDGDTGDTAEAETTPQTQVDSTSIGQDVTPQEPSALRAAFEQTAAQPPTAAGTVTQGGTPLATAPNDERAMWLLQGMQNFPKLRQALSHAYAQESAAGKKRAPINLGQGVLYDPNTGQYLASEEFKNRVQGKSNLKREEQYLQFLNQRELELTRQMGRAKSFEERGKFEALRAQIARERIISQEKVANIKAGAKVKAAGDIAGAIRGNKLPAAAAKGIQESRQNMRRAEEALSALEGNPDAVGFKGFAPQAWLNRMDPKGVEARAAIADLGSMIVHDRSGAAVTAAEFPRLQPFIPDIRDDFETARKKLRRFVQVYKEYEQSWIGLMGESFGGEPTPKGPPGSSSQPTYKYDAHGNPMK